MNAGALLLQATAIDVVLPDSQQPAAVHLLVGHDADTGIAWFSEPRRNRAALDSAHRSLIRNRLSPRT